MPSGPARHRWRWLWLALAVIVAGSAGGGLAGWRWWKDAIRAPGPLEQVRAFVVPHGGTAHVAAALANAGIVGDVRVFRAAVWATRKDGTLHAAEFLFPAHASVMQVLAVLRTARPVEHHLTIAEGLTAQQIVAVVARGEAMTGDVKVIEEGSVLPQTYDYEYGADRAALVARAEAAMDKQVRALWTDRAPGLPLSSPRAAVALASIVERETAKPEERAHIAAVYENRLRQGMRLQADPTVVYAVSGGLGEMDRKLTKADLAVDDPFNTYRVSGLPPGPICSPGVESLKAVLHPANSPDLYFVADGAGGHVFSKDIKAHDMAVARYRALPNGMNRGSPE